MAGSDRTDFIDLDLTQVPEKFHSVFEEAELFYESNFEFTAKNQELYAAAELPSKIEIVATLADLDDNIAGQAGPTYAVFNTTDGTDVFLEGASAIVVTQGIMTFDTDFIETAVDLEIASTLMIHEMGHVLGFGTLWEIHGVKNPNEGNYNQVSTFLGTETNAVRMYQIEAVETVQQIPLENQGGSGTAGSHWDLDKPLFGANSANSNEVMAGFLSFEPYISRTSMEAFADLGFIYKDSVLE